MAKIKGLIAFTGTLGELTAYQMRGVQGTVVRRNSEGRSKAVRTDENYKNTRLLNKEWAGCTKASQAIRAAIQGIRHLGDHNYSGFMNGVCKKIQEDDDSNLVGSRSIRFSKSGFKLEGFNLAAIHTFDKMLQSSPSYSIDRPNARAVVTIPAVIPGLNFRNPSKQPLYRFVFVLGAIADFIFDKQLDRYVAENDPIIQSCTGTTAWHHWTMGNDSAEITLGLDGWQNETKMSLVLAAGIEFGIPFHKGGGKYVKYAGAGKILKLV